MLWKKCLDPRKVSLLDLIADFASRLLQICRDYYFGSENLITHIVEKNNGNLIYDVLSVLYQSVSVPGKLLLRNKLSTICMSDIDTMVSYLAKITVLKDHLAAIGTKEKDEKLVSIMLNWFDSSLKFFVQGVRAHEDLPTNKLWSKLNSRPFAPKSRKWW